MKKVIVLLIGVVSTTCSFAQLSFGIQGTGNLSDASIDAPELVSLNKKARVFPSAGVFAELGVGKNLSVRGGVNFLQHGIKLSMVTPGVPGEIDEIRSVDKATFNYLQVPVNLLYNVRTGIVNFYGGGGPYASYALSGKSKQESSIKYSDGTTETEKEETDIFEKDEEGNRAFKRFDYGVGVLAGVKLPNGVFAQVGYQLSLANISNDDVSKYRNRGLQLTVGFTL